MREGNAALPSDGAGGGQGGAAVDVILRRHRGSVSRAGARFRWDTGHEFETGDVRLCARSGHGLASTHVSLRVNHFS